MWLLSTSHTGGTCDDAALHDVDGQPCKCGLTFDDVHKTVIYPHTPLSGWPIRIPTDPPRRNKLFDALADAGVTEDDYLQIQKARRLVDTVNARLASRGATLMYAVTCNPVGGTPVKVAAGVQPLSGSFTEGS